VKYINKVDYECLYKSNKTKGKSKGNSESKCGVLVLPRSIVRGVGALGGVANES
jgi:hypothetical protein